ncbi:MAG: Hsp20/alpha crystallin family protein [Desulfobacteraceae bacterium]|nr:Hsp20/alpha crystallin family protein [Desulfobacteraceae bacterium]
MTTAKELQVKEKQEVSSAAEQTKPGLVFTPAVDIFESDREITLLADMPGVAANDISIDLRDGVLTISGDVKPWESAEEKDVLIEFEVGKYYRQFTLSEAIDQAKIDAQLKEGVLKLALPKLAKAQPRKIAVNAG